MGLKKDIVTDSGILIKSAYFRIAMYEGNKNTTTLYIDVYNGRESFLEGMETVQRLVYYFEPKTHDDSPNIFK